MYPNDPNQPPQITPPPSSPPPTYPPQPAAQPQQQPWAQPAQTPGGVAPIDYLNQIATPPKQTTGFSRKQFAIIGGAFLLVFGIVALFAIINGSRPDLTTQSQQLVAKVAALQEVAKNAQKNIKSRSLSSANSGLTVQLTSAQASLTETFSGLGVNVTKPGEKVLAAVSTKELSSRLDDARLNAIFDRVYAREMSHELSTTLISLKSIYETASNPEVKKKLEETYNNLEPLQKQLAEFDGATS